MAISLGQEYATQFYSLIEEQSISPSGAQKAKQDWRRWHDSILRELDGQYDGDEKMFGKSVLHITSRDQQNRYELVAKILGNDVGRQVLSDRNL